MGQQMQENVYEKISNSPNSKKKFPFLDFQIIICFSIR
jgi:hypothetical protein